MLLLFKYFDLQWVCSRLSLVFLSTSLWCVFLLLRMKRKLLHNCPLQHFFLASWTTTQTWNLNSHDHLLPQLNNHNHEKTNVAHNGMCTANVRWDTTWKLFNLICSVLPTNYWFNVESYQNSPQYNKTIMFIVPFTVLPVKNCEQPAWKRQWHWEGRRGRIQYSRTVNIIGSAKTSEIIGSVLK
jgi:hypothetical protein